MSVDLPLVVAGALTGFVVGLTGVGGGALMTPLLLLVFGIAPVVAVGTDLWFAAITKIAAVGVHHLRGLIDWQIALRLWAGSISGCLLMLAIMGSPHFPPVNVDFLRLAIGMAVLATVAGLVAQRPLLALCKRATANHARLLAQAQFPATVIAGFLLGVLVTLTSIGAGALGAVALSILYPERLSVHRLIATDIVHAVPLALLAGLGHQIMGNVDAALLGNLLLGSIPAVLVGARLSARLPHRLLRIALAAVLAAVGIKLTLT